MAVVGTQNRNGYTGFASMTMDEYMADSHDQSHGDDHDKATTSDSKKHPWVRVTQIPLPSFAAKVSYFFFFFPFHLQPESGLQKNSLHWTHKNCKKKSPDTLATRRPIGQIADGAFAKGRGLVRLPKRRPGTERTGGIPVISSSKRQKLADVPFGSGLRLRPRLKALVWAKGSSILSEV